MIYILELDKPLGSEKHSAKYYVGWVQDGLLERRLAHHRSGNPARGSHFTAAAVQRGIEFKVVLTIPNATREDERRIKNQKNTKRFIDRYQKQQAVAQ